MRNFAHPMEDNDMNTKTTRITPEQVEGQMAFCQFPVAILTLHVKILFLRIASVVIPAQFTMEKSQLQPSSQIIYNHSAWFQPELSLEK